MQENNLETTQLRRKNFRPEKPIKSASAIFFAWFCKFLGRSQPFKVHRFWSGSSFHKEVNQSTLEENIFRNMVIQAISHSYFSSLL